MRQYYFMATGAISAASAMRMKTSINSKSHVMKRSMTTMVYKFTPLGSNTVQDGSKFKSSGAAGFRLRHPSNSSLATAPTAASSIMSARSFSDGDLSAQANSIDNVVNTSILSSKRGRRAPTLLPTYLGDARQVECYHPEKCPDGALNLSVAENYMLEDLLVPAYREAIEQHLFQADRIYYQPTQGRADMRQALCQHYVPALLNGIKFKEENLIVGAGCNAVLENLAISLADSGEGVMLPVPYYAAFEFDLVARANLQIIPVEPTPDLVMTRSNTEVKATLPADAFYPTSESLSMAYDHAVEAGITPKILLLSHPNNPLGVNYPRRVLEECLDWALEHSIHIISDEIYAGSVYKATGTTNETDGTEFVSMMQIASERKLGPSDDGKIGIGNMVHWVYAISKDFCSSGLRVGLSYTENDEILTPLIKLNDLCQVSSQTQALVQHTFGKPDFVANFLKEAQLRLRKRSTKVHAKCKELGVPTLHSEAGMFLWVDLSEFMANKTNASASVEEQERVLYKELIHYGLLLTPGTSMKMPFPGAFRIVYTAVKTEEEVDLGLQRLENFVHANRA